MELFEFSNGDVVDLSTLGKPGVASFSLRREGEGSDCTPLEKVLLERIDPLEGAKSSIAENAAKEFALSVSDGWHMIRTAQERRSCSGSGRQHTVKDEPKWVTKKRTRDRDEKANVGAKRQQRKKEKGEKQEHERKYPQRLLGEAGLTVIEQMAHVLVEHPGLSPPPRRARGSPWRGRSTPRRAPR